MFPYSTILLMAAIMGGQPIEKKELFQPNLYLVRAKALTYSYGGDGLVHCFFEIEHVFIGPDSLKEEHFEAWKRPPSVGFGQFPNWTVPEIKKGEVSIWWITERPAKKKEGSVAKQKTKKTRLVAAENNPKTADAVLMFPPARRRVLSGTDADDEWDKMDAKRYKYVEKFSLSLERIYRASDEKRLDILKALGRRDAPFLQVWCLQKLRAVLALQDYVAYLTDLAPTTTLPLLMEYEVDCQLNDLSPAWCNSEIRLKILQRWMNGKLNDGKSELEEEDLIYIVIRANYTDLHYPTFFRLMIDGLTTDRRSEDFKKSLLTTIVYKSKPKDLASVDDGFAYLMSQIRKADPNRRLAAARLLMHLIPLCKRQHKAVKALRDDPAYQALAEPLAEVLDETELVLDGLSGFDGFTYGEDRKVFMWVVYLKWAPQPQAVRFIREHVRPARVVDVARVRQLISDLDHKELHRREAASRQLAALGPESEPALCTAFAHSKSAEVRRQLDLLLKQVREEGTIALRAIPILAKMTIPEAYTLLKQLASGAQDSPITHKAKKVLIAKALATILG